MKTPLLVLAILVASAPALSAQKSKKKILLLPGQGIDWKGDWDEAVKEAKARNVPIMFVAHTDNVPACTEMAEKSFTDKKVLAKAQYFVFVIAHRATGHGDTERAVGREKKTLCNRYYTIPCSVHVKGEPILRRFFNLEAACAALEKRVGEIN